MGAVTDGAAVTERFCGMEPLNILLVEDTASDALLMLHALKSAGIPCDMHTIQGGDEVLPWLAASLQKGEQYLPDVILLDLGLPRTDGFEVLDDLVSAHPALRAIPVVILTAYEHFDYIRDTHKLCVPAYLNKPCDPAHLRDVLKRVRH